MKMKLFLLLCMYVTSLTIVFGQITNDTGFLPNEGQTSSLNDNNTEADEYNYAEAIEIPTCPGNMTPGSFIDELDHFSWRCQCNSKFLYFPSTESCHEVYRQGPCPPGQYVNQSSIDIEVGRCVRNPCLVDGLVPYNGSCYILETDNGPCPPNHILMVETESFRVICHDTSNDLLEHFAVVSVVEAPKKVKKQPGPPCPAGKKRARNGACMTVWSKIHH